MGTTSDPSDPSLSHGVDEEPVEMAEGRFVVFEGLDGAGTTTQLGYLAEWLRNVGVQVEMTKEPSNGPVGAALRQAIEGRVTLDPVSIALAFAADRADHLFNTYNGVVGVLSKGGWVLCDRYLFSSLAYQVGSLVTEEWLREINRHALEPDLTVFVDTVPGVCLERISSRSGKTELFHNENSLEETFRNYQRLISGGGLVGRLVVVNGDGKPDDVFADLIRQFLPWFEEVTDQIRDSS